MILKAENISKTYKMKNDELQILNALSISILPGEIAVLMGPSGSGKSTLLHILGTLDTDYTGDIYIENKLINYESDFAAIRSNKLGFVFQFHHLLPEFTVYENLIIPQMILNNDAIENKEFVLKLLKIVNLENRKDHYPNQISGGEKQRVAILRALVNRPLLVLADEPTGNLDRENSNLLVKLVSELRDKFNQSFLIATHDEDVTEIADRILTLKNGKIIE